MASPWPNEESKFRKRASSYGLRLDLAPVDEVVMEGRELFQCFLASEIRREGLTEPDSLTPYVMFNDDTHDTPSGIPNGGASPTTATRTPRPVSGVNSPASEHYNNPVWARTGKELRQLADEFAKTRERKEIKQRAKRVSLSQEFTYEQFQDLVSTLFSGGMTRERIVVLFFFCSDLAILVLTQNLDEFFQQILKWSLRYISDKVCSWVRAHGGWEAVIHGTFRYLQYAAAGALIVTAICLGWVWIKKRSSGN